MSVTRPGGNLTIMRAVIGLRPHDARESWQLGTGRAEESPTLKLLYTYSFAHRNVLEWESIDLDTRDPENTCPFRDFGLQKACKFVRSYSGGLKTEACQPLLHLWRGDGRSDFSVEQSDDVSWSLGRGEHPDHTVALHL